MKKFELNNKAQQFNTLYLSQPCLYSGSDWFVVPTFKYNYNRNLSNKGGIK